jgi:hypothetical protein
LLKDAAAHLLRKSGDERRRLPELLGLSLAIMQRVSVSKCPTSSMSCPNPGHVRASSREGLLMERYRAGGMPNSRLKARLNAASDS